MARSTGAGEPLYTEAEKMSGLKYFFGEIIILVTVSFIFDKNLYRYFGLI